MDTNKDRLRKFLPRRNAKNTKTVRFISALSVLGKPVTFAARWGLPLSKGYLAHLAARRRKAANGNPPAVVQPRSVERASQQQLQWFNNVVRRLHAGTCADPSGGVVNWKPAAGRDSVPG